MSSTKEEVAAVAAEAQTEDGVAEAAGALVGRLFEAGLGFMELLTVYTGERLGLYRALAEGGPATPQQLASRAGIHERYGREWLEQQASGGFVEVDDPAKPAEERRYSLSAGHAAALADPESPFYIAYFSRFVPGMATQAPAVIEAFRTGGGVPWSAFGPDVIEGQGDYNRPWLLGALGTEHIPAIPGVHARLQADPPARVLDAACGVGWAAIALALAYPNVRVDGVDPDESSIVQARKHAAARGVSDRVRFQVKDAAHVGGDGPYDLAIVIESIHDMSHPVEALDGIRRSLAAGGTLIVADEKVGEAFTAPGDFGERFCYASSVMLCLPSAMAEQPSAAVGAVMRPDTFRRLASEAGFGDVRILDEIQHDALRFYGLNP
jgi:2-polyprenyl-3-methyl-5-hydroxy-6-metoxy-1,4-benzoquinol methylase